MYKCTSTNVHVGTKEVLDHAMGWFLLKFGIGYMQGQSPQAIPLQATTMRISRLAAVAGVLSILWLVWFVLGGLWSKISGLS